MDRAVPIHTVDGGVLLGLAADLSDRGLQLRTGQPMAEGSRWQLYTRFKEPVMEQERVEFVAEVRWCRPHDNGNGYDVGMHIVEIGARGSAALSYFARHNARA
jgi:hypothetical protein